MQDIAESCGTDWDYEEALNFFTKLGFILYYPEGLYFENSCLLLIFL